MTAKVKRVTIFKNMKKYDDYYYDNVDADDMIMVMPVIRDGKTCGYCGYIRAIFVQPVLIFWLYTRKQTISTVLFCTVLKAIS